MSCYLAIGQKLFSCMTTDFRESVSGTTLILERIERIFAGHRVRTGLPELADGDLLNNLLILVILFLARHEFWHGLNGFSCRQL